MQRFDLISIVCVALLAGTYGRAALVAEGVAEPAPAPPPVARTLVVSKDGTGDFQSIQEAVDAARSGDTVVITSGEYREDVTIHSKDGLRIVGDDRDRVHVRGQGRFGVFYIGKWPYGATNIEVSRMTIHEHGGLAFGIFNGHGVVLRDLEIEGSLFAQQVQDVRIEGCRIGGSETTGVQLADSEATLVGNLIHDNDHGVSVAGRSHVRLERNVITRSLFEAVLVKDRAQAALVRNTLVKNGGGAAFLDESHSEVNGNIVGFNKVGFRLGPDSQATIAHNAMYNSDENYRHVGRPDHPAPELDLSNLVADPRFVDLAANDFRLRPDTPLRQVGGFPYLGALAPADGK